MLIHTERTIARKTPVYDHADKLLYQADRDKARELLARSDVDIIGTNTRIKALRYRGPDPAHKMGGSHHKRGVGVPHRNENYYNVRGCWHLDRIPVAYHPHFIAILTDRLVLV
jgi:hypothetical protein